MTSFQEYQSALKNYLADKRLLYHIETYGCQMNVRDSETIAGILEDAGFVHTASVESADLVIFNTCCVRDHAEKRLLGNIGALKERKMNHPDMIIGVCGCMMQQKDVSDRLFRRFPFVDFIFGTKTLERLPVVILDALKDRTRIHDSIPDDFLFKMPEELPAKRNSAVSAFVNIMYGCNNFCSYCVVPYVRGREISRDPGLIMDEVRRASADGYSEITLLGQNVNSYHSTDGLLFPELLKMVSEVDGVKRLRFMTSHPKDLSSELIDAMSGNGNICHHVHLPVQSGSDRILKLMNRKYDTERYYEVVSELRSKIPDIELTTDIIVGFPGETDSDFEDTLHLVDRIGFASAFTFKYSPRNGTVAASMSEQIPETVKKERLRVLNTLQDKKSQENNQKYVGAYGVILVEGADGKQETVYGKFGNFKMVYLNGTVSDIGKYIDVQVDSVFKKSLFGHRIGGK